jgi:hypothetical protein
MATPTTRPRRARALAVIAAALAALAVWLVTDPLLGIHLTGPTAPGSQQLQPITPAMVAGGSLVAALAGWALLALLERFTARPHHLDRDRAAGRPALPGRAAVHPRQQYRRHSSGAGPHARCRRRRAHPHAGRHLTRPRPASTSPLG